MSIILEEIGRKNLENTDVLLRVISMLFQEITTKDCISIKDHEKAQLIVKNFLEVDGLSVS